MYKHVIIARHYNTPEVERSPREKMMVGKFSGGAFAVVNFQGVFVAQKFSVFGVPSFNPDPWGNDSISRAYIFSKWVGKVTTNPKRNGYLLYIWDSTTQFYGGYNQPL